MKVAKWGNSLAVRLPVEFVKEMGLKEGDDLQLQPIDPPVCASYRKPTQEELWEAVKKYRGRMPKNFKFNREEANERG